MLFNMPKISFFLRSNNDLQNTHVIYCRVTFNGTKTEFSLKEKLDKSNWDQSSQKFKGNKLQKMYIEQLLDTVRYKLKSIALVDDDISAYELVKKLKPKKVENVLLTEIIKKYIDAVKGNVSESTINNHLIKLKNLKSFEIETKERFTQSSFSLVVAEQFKNWFMKRCNTQKVDSANRNVLLFRSAIVWAIKQGIVKESDLVAYQGQKDKIEKPIFLTMEDLGKLMNHNFENAMLQRIRDLFVFQCFTGLSYGDLWGDWKIKATKNGNVLTGTRIKNGQKFFVPVQEIVLQLLDKYEGQLPRYVNECYNRVLKEIASICQIDKKITTHTGRKTFATLSDADGWSRETVSKMLGHRSYRTTETYYLGESFSRIENEMEKRKKGA